MLIICHLKQSIHSLLHLQEVVYKIPCKYCERVYVRETGRPLEVRIKEHRKEVDRITEIFTRAEKTRAASVCNKSAITDHVCNENHVIDWVKGKGH